MWIRSQDKTKLINANEIWINNMEEKDCLIKCNTQSISSTGAWIVGEYRYSERCIEILDEIQKIIGDYMPANKNQYDVVFEMPEE